jgi:thioredoxin:protein disulfide reductase
MRRDVPLLLSLALMAAMPQGAHAEVVFTAQGAWAPAPPAAGGTATAIVTVTVEEGWHVNSSTPLDEYLIPTRVSLVLPPGWKADTPVYPAHRLANLSFSDTPVAVFEGEFTVRVRVQAAAAASPHPEISGIVEAQACNDRQCMAPEEVAFTVTGSIADPTGGLADGQASRIGETATASGGGGAPSPGGLSQRFLAGGLLLQLALVFVGGLALNLTPCVFPLIQITIGFFLAQKQSRGWLLALTYALGMVVTYSSLGVVAALTGSLFGAALQSPWVIAVLVAVLIALAASMFGAWELRVPQWATRASGGRQGHAGALVMGLVAGVVAAPCIGPFVLGLLTLVGQKGDPVYGFAMFFTLALGLSLPYVVLATSTTLIEKLPNAGAWMLSVRQLFGVLLLILAVYFVKPFIPGGAGDLVEAIARILGGLYLLVVARPGHEMPAIDRIMRLASAAILAAGIIGLPGRTHAGDGAELEWMRYDEASVQVAISSGQPVVLDFYADWCIPCKELDEKAFSHPEVAARLAGFARFKVDLTRSTPENAVIRERYQALGVPTIVFYNRGQEVAGTRLSGFEEPAEFLARLDRVSAP